MDAPWSVEQVGDVFVEQRSEARERAFQKRGRHGRGRGGQELHGLALSRKRWSGSLRPPSHCVQCTTSRSLPATMESSSSSPLTRTIGDALGFLHTKSAALSHLPLLRGARRAEVISLILESCNHANHAKEPPRFLDQSALGTVVHSGNIFLLGLQTSQPRRSLHQYEQIGIYDDSTFFYNFSDEVVVRSRCGIGGVTRPSTWHVPLPSNLT